VRAHALAILIALSAGCALRGPVVQLGPDDRLDTVEIDGQVFRIHYWQEDEAAAAQVARALARAVPRIARWGKLTKEVTITIRPTHEALEKEVHVEGYDWLRAWARYQIIDLQSPRTWGWFGAKDSEVVEILTHELTHCAMYQAAASEWTWPHKGIPLWFMEGLASVTAEEGYRRLSSEELWRYYTKTIPGAGGGFPAATARAARGFVSQDGDPVTDPEPLRQESSPVVYGAAHRSFEFRLARYGEQGVRSALKLMSEGRSFEKAFEEAFGITESAFASEFRRYVLWQGWRRN
jgi:hypothetical protein